MRIFTDKRPLTYLMLIVAAAASGWWLNRLHMEPVEDRKPLMEEFDYYLSVFTLDEMDKQGALKQTLLAENLYHYPDREQSTLTRPRLLFFEGDRTIWEISAQTGLIHDTDRSVSLNGEVHIQYTGESHTQDFEIFTDDLQVWQDGKVAETADPVRIVQEAGTTWSTGMRIELDLRRIHLLTDVRGDYVPW